MWVKQSLQGNLNRQKINKVVLEPWVSPEHTSNYVDTVTVIARTWTKGHWPLDDLWPHIFWGHMCDSTQGSLCPSPTKKNQCGYSDPFCKNLNQRSLTPRWPLIPHLLRSHVWLYPKIIVSRSHGNTSMYVDTVTHFAKTWTKSHWPIDDLWPHICWGHMCDSTQGSLCPGPMGISQCMWIQWSILQITHQRSLTPRWPLTPHLLRSYVWCYPRTIVSKSHENTSKYVDTVTLFAKTWTKCHWPIDDLWPHICWGHMCDSTQGSLCPGPMGIHQCMWIQGLFCKNLNQRSLTPRWPLTHICWGHICDSTQGSLCPSPMKIHQCGYSDPFWKTWTKGHWPLHDLWPHICWGHMCDSTQESLCPGPMGIHQCMWIQWSILQITHQSLTPRWHLTPHLLRSYVWCYQGSLCPSPMKIHQSMWIQWPFLQKLEPSVIDP